MLQIAELKYARNNGLQAGGGELGCFTIHPYSEAPFAPPQAGHKRNNENSLSGQVFLVNIGETSYAEIKFKI